MFFVIRPKCDGYCIRNSHQTFHIYIINNYFFVHNRKAIIIISIHISYQDLLALFFRTIFRAAASFRVFALFSDTVALLITNNRRSYNKKKQGNI